MRAPPPPPLSHKRRRGVCGYGNGYERSPFEGFIHVVDMPVKKRNYYELYPVHVI